MDDADRAEDCIERALEDALAEVRCARDRGPRAVGACLYCGADLPAPMRFCDALCRDAWDREQRIRRMMGAL